MSGKIYTLSLLLLLATLSGSAFAEYYLVYTPPVCDDCTYTQTYSSTPHHYKHRVKKSPYYTQYQVRHSVIRHASIRRVHVMPGPTYVVGSQKPASEHRQRTTCGDCETCACDGGYVVSTSQPEYPDEHCTTYEDVVQGEPSS